MNNNEDVLIQVAKSLDISPTDFQRAQTRYRAVRDWLLSGQYQFGVFPRVYLQGSFRLGTVIRPYYADRDGEFDIDQVFEFEHTRANITPKILKSEIGNRLKSHSTYLALLDAEGRRCWTLIYASDENQPGFHLDILPSVLSPQTSDSQIDITHKKDGVYSWTVSDPEGYYRWFKSRNIFDLTEQSRQINQLFENNRELYEEVSNVPRRLIRSSLQRAIQLMKRNRDIYFSNKPYKPISIILTTLATHLYQRGNIAETIASFTRYVIERERDLLANGVLLNDGILDFIDGRWFITNPVDIGKAVEFQENFADRWELEPEYGSAFFEWVRSLDRTMDRFERSGASRDLDLKLPEVGEEIQYSEIVLRESKEANFAHLPNATDHLLKLIHLGIEEKLEWSEIKRIATEICDAKTGIEDSEIARINYYQIDRHRGRDLTPEAVRDIKGILERRSNRPAFVMCGNLLLGSATKKMIKECVASDLYACALNWPIMKLASADLFW